MTTIGNPRESPLPGIGDIDDSMGWAAPLPLGLDGAGGQAQIKCLAVALAHLGVPCIIETGYSRRTGNYISVATCLIVPATEEVVQAFNRARVISKVEENVTLEGFIAVANAAQRTGNAHTFAEFVISDGTGRHFSYVSLQVQPVLPDTFDKIWAAATGLARPLENDAFSKVACASLQEICSGFGSSPTQVTSGSAGPLGI